MVPEHLVIELCDLELVGLLTVHNPQAALALWVNQHRIPAAEAAAHTTRQLCVTQLAKINRPNTPSMPAPDPIAQKKWLLKSGDCMAHDTVNC